MDIQNYQTTLNTLHNGFIVCAIFAAIFFVTAVLLFWRFGMFAIIRQRFGFEAKRSMEEFKEQNEVTGVPKYHSVALGERTPRIQLKPKDAPGAAQAAEQAAEHTPSNESVAADAELDEESTPFTTRLDAEGVSPATPRHPERRGVSPAVEGSYSEDSNDDAQTARFEVTKNILLIHTSRDTLVP
jgi:hypothetical protein